MITTPLITKIKTSGGTLYTFTSTSKDLTRVAVNNSNYKFKFSHFACLNLPYIMDGNMSQMSYKNEIDTQVFRDIKSYIQSDLFKIEIELLPEYEEKLKNNECYVLLESPTNNIFNTVVKDGNIHVSTIEDVDSDNRTPIKFKVQIKLDNSKTITTDTLEYNPYYVGNNVEKGLYLENFDNYKFSTPYDFNISMAEHFQNYILNFESVILNGLSTNSQNEQNTFNQDSSLRSPSERIFFNWLRKVGGIRFIESTVDNDGNTLYRENVNSYGNNVDVNLDRTVQYLGDIDVINKVDVNGDTFGEIYLYIPSSVGATPNINFRTIQDSNYKDDMYKYGSERIVGRENYKDEDKPIDNISLEAIYDNDRNGNFYLGDEGYCIDFRNSNEIRTSNSNSYINFEFNCVLIYYDLIKNTNGKEEYATNLYGVLFLDNFKHDNTNTTDKYLAHIDTLPKLRSSELDDGNSFALKVDIKFDTAPTTTMTRIGNCDCISDTLGDFYYDPNDVKGFDMYNKALEQLQKCVDIFYTQQHEIYNLQDRIEELESIIINQPSLDKFNETLDVINLKLDNIDKTNITSLTKDIKTIKDFINDKTLEIQLDTNKIKTGNGLDMIVDKTNNSIQFNNTMQNYESIRKVSLNSEIVGNFLYEKDNIVNIYLNQFTNLILLSEPESTDSDICETEQLVFNIKTDISKWKFGQSVKFVEYDNLKLCDIRHDSIKIQTTVNDEVYIIKEFSRLEIDKMKDKTEIEIICINNDFNTTTDKFITIVR